MSSLNGPALRVSDTVLIERDLDGKGKLKLRNIGLNKLLQPPASE